MVAELAPERDFRGPGCGDDCRAIRALLPGQFGRSELMLHDPAPHEAYGRGLSAFRVAEIDVLATGRLTIDLQTFDVAVDGEPVLLTPTEHRLLRSLTRSAGRTVPHHDLLSDGFGLSLEGRRFWQDHAHLIRVSMARLRRKLGPAETLIRTHPGFGYRLELVEVGRSLPAAPRHHGWPPRITTWAKDWDRCQGCGTTERRHVGRGWCSRCRDRERSR